MDTDTTVEDDIGHTNANDLREPSVLGRPRDTRTYWSPSNGQRTSIATASPDRHRSPAIATAGFGARRRCGVGRGYEEHDAFLGRTTLIAHATQ